MSQTKRHFTDDSSTEQPPRKIPPPPPLISQNHHRPPPPPPLRPPTSLPPRPLKPPPSAPPPFSTPPPSAPLTKFQVKAKNTKTQPLMKPKGGFGINIKLGSTSQATKPTTDKEVKKPAAKVAAVFNDEDSSDEEEMPMEAKMRMRNVGRETITSAGPNSFGKTRQGFTDTNRLFERQLKEAMDKVSNDATISTNNK